MSEISNILTKKEKIFWEGKPNFGRYLIVVVFLAISSLIFLVLGLMFKASTLYYQVDSPFGILLFYME